LLAETVELERTPPTVNILPTGESTVDLFNDDEALGPTTIFKRIDFIGESLNTT
jgi:hypothetical protein